MATPSSDSAAPKKGGLKKGGLKAHTAGPAFDVAVSADESTEPAAIAAELAVASPTATDAAAPAAGKKKLSMLFTKGKTEGKATATGSDIAAFVNTLQASIPEPRRAEMLDWKVTQAAITKPAEAKASRVTAKLSRMSTSKIHKFKPVVTLQQAIEWLGGFGHADSSLVFENQCMLVIEKGKFKDFEDLRDSAPSSSGNGGNDDDDNDDDTNSKPPPQDPDSD